MKKKESATCDGDEFSKYMELAERIARSLTRVLVLSENSSHLKNEIKNEEKAMKKGDMHGLYGFHFNPDLFGEAATAPHLRSPPFQEKVYRKVVNTILEAKNGGNTEEGLPGIQPCDVCMLLDGGKPGIAKGIIAPWKGSTPSTPQKEGVPPTTRLRMRETAMTSCRDS